MLFMRSIASSAKVGVDLTTNYARNPWIDALRAIAAMAVALHHFATPTHFVGNFYNEALFYGKYGVEIFFLLSGLCIQSAAHRTSNVNEFLWQRLWRIYPPFIFSLCVLFLVVIARKLLVGVNDAVNVHRGFGDWMTVLTAMSPDCWNLNWPYWTLRYEIIFYIIIGLLLLRKRYQFVILYTLTALTFVVPLRTWPELFFLPYWAVFGLGVGLAEYHRGEKRLSLGLMILCGISWIWFAAPAQIVVVTITFTTLVLASRPGSLLQRPTWLSDIGKSSYSFYLLHVPIAIFLLDGLQHRLSLDNFPGSVFYQCGLIALCVGCANLSYKFVEAPAIKTGKSFAQLNAWFNSWPLRLQTVPLLRMFSK
jgi:peptidoglycan/LPS O-acetylase OafA/YrhL